MSRTPKYEDVVDELKRRYLFSAEEEFDWEVDPFKSPIEKVFVASMLDGGWHPILRIGTSEYAALLDRLAAAGLKWPSGPLTGSATRFYLMEGNELSGCASQATLELRGRVIHPDFAFVFPEPYLTKVIVELDGHDFHERTPEQAQSDKSRDRELQSMGWHVMRFTGREVLRDPSGCHAEVCQLLHAKVALDRWRLLRGEQDT